MPSLLASLWWWRSRPPGLSVSCLFFHKIVSSFLLAPGLSRVDKGAYSPLLLPHIWTQTADISKRGGRGCGSCIWCECDRGPTAGSASPWPKDVSGGWSLLRNLITG